METTTDLSPALLADIGQLIEMHGREAVIDAIAIILEKEENKKYGKT